MKKELLILAVLLLFLCGTLAADEHTDWVSTTTDGEIQYRTDIYANSEACYLEFRDQDQSSRSTTFDAEVDYKPSDTDRDDAPHKDSPRNGADQNEEQATKTDRENIVTTPTHNGSARISNCLGVIAVRLKFVQRN
jgi:hypothetical protein